jgi:hypothetical protein
MPMAHSGDHQYARLIRLNDHDGAGYDTTTNIVYCNRHVWENAAWPFQHLMGKVRSNEEAQEVFRKWGPPVSQLVA